MSFTDIIFITFISSLFLIIYFYFRTKKTGINIFNILGKTIPFITIYYFFHINTFNIAQTFFISLLFIIILIYIETFGICLIFNKYITHT